MKILDWLKGLGKKKSDTGEAASTTPRVAAPGRRRSVAQDARFLPKPPKKNYWERPDPVMDDAEAQRAFSPSQRTRNRALRTSAADPGLLRERGLAPWQDEAALAQDLGISLQRLWWLASHRFDDRVTHYSQFRIPKRRGGYRTIMAPKRGLKAVQRELLRQCMHALPVSEHAHGFVAGRSVATNAAPHVGKRVVICFDLENFFGTVTFGRVRGFLVAMGYDYSVATTLALLTTEAERQPVEVDGALRYVPIGHRACVQGAPTSPVLCNAIASKLDQRLAGFARAHGFAYTRYADDLTFSGDDESKIALLLRVVDELVTAEGFRLNREKTRVMRSGRRQTVAGVVVNDVIGLSRAERRKLRAKIHQMNADADAPQVQRLRGELAYLQMLNPAQADALRPDWL